jgi:hypothetical protein
MRWTLLLWLFVGAVVVPPHVPARAAEAELPAGADKPALEFTHFPDRLHAFVWRNWNVVPTERLAKVLETTPEKVRAVAASMGMPAEAPVPEAYKTRGYITIIRRNWHLLPYEQLLALLEMTPAQLAETLREDDFLWIKLGQLKPRCEPLKYAPPTPEAAKRAAEIKQIVDEQFAAEWAEPEEPRFAFVEQLSKPRPGPITPARQEGLRYIYSYFALFGDPLLDPGLDPFPDGLLQRLADQGVNGVWLHVVLRQLAPGGPDFPEFGEGHETRLKTLAGLVQRAKRYGVNVYLYMNEPRAMPLAFFDRRPEMKGVVEGDHAAMCTSDPKVRRWMADALAHVFTAVPDLGGIFTISASENLTNCVSHLYDNTTCGRCKARPAAEIVAEVNVTLAEGMRRSSPNAKMICYDWQWRDEWIEPIHRRLPKDTYVLCVSEWSQPFTRGGVAGALGEYSMSVVGPGPRAKRNWSIARRNGLRPAAKLQLNNTWEMSAVPYMPVLDLVAEHCANLAEEKVDGLMLSWSLGGYPSPNLDVANRFSADPSADKDAVLDAVARDRYGAAGAAHARAAWARFSDAFREYPYTNEGLYVSPNSYGPSNLLYPTPTGYSATMLGFPYDQVHAWRGTYPADVFAAQMEKVSSMWRPGLPELERAVASAPAERKADAEAELRFARVTELHFRSVANQTRFVVARDALAAAAADDDPARARQADTLRRVVADEMKLARALFTLAREDSRVGYEASNHYYYLPQDLVEKFVNCRHVLDRYAR